MAGRKGGGEARAKSATDCSARSLGVALEEGRTVVSLCTLAPHDLLRLCHKLPPEHHRPRPVAQRSRGAQSRDGILRREYIEKP